MAGRTQQFLRNEYIQPPPGPPTLDAKNSPLALLAQTCSAIGKDTTKTSTNNKICPERKRSPSIVALHKPPPPSASSSSSSRTSPAGANSPSRGSASPTNHRAPMKREKSPSRGGPSSPQKQRSSPDSIKSCPDSVRSIESSSASGIKNEKSSRVAGDHKRAPEAKRRHTTSYDDTSSKHSGGESSAAMRHKSSPTASPNRPFTSNCACPLTTTAATDSTRHTAHGSGNSSSSSSPPQAISMLSLYDPFCIGCQGPHVPGNSCYDGLKNSQLPFYPFASPAAASTYYAQMVMAAAARNGLDPMPHVCNWVNVGSGSCGKRFSTAEELSNHLRTHALPSTSAASTTNSYLLNGLDKLAANPYAAYLSQHAAALAAVSPSASNPASSFLSRSHSPVGRYHPYKNSNMLGQLSAVPPIPIAAGAGPYCSPFALYGQRLGAAAAGFSYP